ncbi:TetR/AcrR family transcriptional regulator [Deinococcus arenicola]|uniref:TetR/AcrR family transcriptional regulator n=1 Tax=Deinococcus arenicola TaxID=2994950 RepID=A0ABU4DMS7_9DEIO|nr:TetR/AcrR family transcriptional regulator [Deinococcus sp. ZS9-10]MDV6373734.1 TetR/AcrR family transcriptional regulator [Deinococcus sp. ZS9-10]
MPRIVDHDQRRAELTQAVWSLIREQGLAGVTIRNLSGRSGWSSGAIRHYLPNREAILNFAAGQIGERAWQRLQAIPVSGDPFQDFLNRLEVTLPLEEEGRVWLEVWLAFVGAAVSDQDFADAQGVLYRDLNGIFVEAFGTFAQGGWLPAHTPQAAATEIHALLDGLSVHLLLHQITPEQARVTLQAALSRMLVNLENSD